ncbi:MAG: hypothetical protein OIF35_04185 [Cellvibrionaceae bacterium]|nr:hypothetical protein [Cellvibrionaceae bacterium]MCV6627562.1 hypothetical protein [Cellvibrionaceae bacterium]
MNPEEYKLAWLIYLGGSLVISFAWWQITRAIGNRYIRNILRILVLVLLFTPHSSAPDQLLMAPALFVTALDPLFLDDGSPLRAGVPLLKVLGFVLAIYLLFDFLLRGRRARKAEAQKMEAERQALLEASRQQGPSQ